VAENLGGRPRKEVDWVTFEKLCAMHCTQEEIANFLEMSVDTLERRVKEDHDVGFAELYRQKRAKGRISLRRKMMEVAQGGNVAMLIFLSKNLLGFGDRVVTESAEDNEKSKLIIDFGEEKPKEPEPVA
jgi:hypothetical protein